MHHIIPYIIYLRFDVQPIFFFQQHFYRKFYLQHQLAMMHIMWSHNKLFHLIFNVFIYIFRMMSKNFYDHRVTVWQRNLKSFPPFSGLFHKGHSMSGSTLLPWTQAEKLREKTEVMATLLGCPVYTSKEIVDCLRHRPAKKIVELVKTYFMVRFLRDGTLRTGQAL